ncbi:MAG: T9SS type A sorting domain-containing protein, partial [Candidatus Cloacimonetes bacterium]|nr:T9SS type A sorting domain-containing protein [Candidatus Cloacimonadota bacterium]
EHSMMTIKAIAFKEEWDASQIAVGTYNVTGTVSEVIFTPAGGNYQSAQQVVLTSLTDGAYFRYTLDGTEPTNSSPLYTTAITVPLNSSVTITARAYKSGWAPSAVGSQTYNVTGQVSWPAMVFTPAGGTYPAPVEVSIALPNPADATIRYTLDGSNPSATNGTVYTGAPIHIGENSTLKAIAFKEGWGASSIASAAYQFGVALPVFTPAAGTYQNSIDVSISSTTPAALIRYTTDGTNPTPEHGNVYLSPITLPEDSVTLFKAIAYLDNWNASAVVTANYIITGKVSDVTFSIPSGTYTTSQILVLNTTTPGASIYYTLDGSEPTQGSTLYTSAIIIPQNSQMTVKARAFRSGWIPSNITSGVYNVTGTTAFTSPNFIPAPGTYGNPINVGIGSAIPSDAAIYYTIDGTETSPSNGTLYSAPIPVNEALTIRAVAVKDGWVSGHISGEYTFAAAAPVFNPPAGSYPTTQHVVLSSATVGALIRYTTDGSDPSPTNGENYTGSIVVNINQTIKAYAYKAGYEDSPIAIGTYAIGTYVPVVATPVFNPLPGNYVAPIDVTISTSTADATIRYTTDGSTPTPSSPVFTSVIHIPNHTAVTIKAIAYKDEWDDSQMAVATYSVTGTVEDVVFSPEGGAYTTAQNVVLTTPTPGAAIFYTLNGDTPTDASTQYTQAIQVPLNSSVTIRAVAYKNGWMFSSVGSQTYNITGQVVIPGQVFNPVAGTYTQPQIVTIATATIPVGATIRYTVNGDDPTIDSPEYTGQTIIAGLNAITTVKARAFLTGWVDSPVYEAVYNVTGTIQLPAVVFTPPAGTYQTAQNVTLNAPTVPAGVSYYYTTDGSDPTDASLLYQGPIPLPLDSGITQIKVRAYKEGWVPSAVASATYNITGTVVYMTPVFLPPAGTYQTAQQITINSVNPSDATVRYTLDGSEPTQTSPIYTSPITLPLESGTTTIKTKAFKTDWTASQTHSATYTITGQVSIAAPVFDPIPGTYVNPQSVAVIPYVTPATAQIRYTLDGSDPTPTSPVYSGEIPAPAYTTTRIKVRAYATDWAPSPVYEGIYVVNGAASINGVVFTPPAGTYTTAQRLVISTNTLPIDADIYYTIDGSDPTSGSTPYTTPIHLDLDREITVKVRAYGDQYWDPSPVYTAHYVMTGRVQIPEPVFSPDPSVVYTEATMVTIDEPIPAAATVRYTLDGSDPDESSTIYDGQIGVPLNTVMQIKARAYLSDWDASPIYSATYTLSGKVELADQPFSPAPGIYTAAQQIAIATPVLPDNGIIRYTINGDDPDETSVQYTGPITIPLDSDWQIKIRGFAPNWIPSDVMTAHYVVTGVVEDPVFVVNGEAYTGAEEYLSSEAINIVLETSTAGARIYYTMAMGSDPEEPTTASQLFDAENPIVISELDLDVRIRAKAFKEHWIDSEDDTHSFTVIPAPYNVRSLSYGGYIRLLWNSDISTRGLDGFNIYRRKTTESSWTKINSSLVNSKLGDDYYYDDYAIENRVSYVYRVTAVYSGKEGPYSNTTAIEYQTSELEISSATHAYPNPATSSTNIKLMLTRNDNVTVSVSIYDFGGKKIRTITVPATNSNMIEIPWDLMNSSGKKVGRGTYFARIIANDGVNKAERTIKISVK